MRLRPAFRRDFGPAFGPAFRPALVAALLGAAAFPAAAQSVEIGAAGPAVPTGPLGRDDLSADPVTRAVAQTFVAPAGAPVLESFRFLLGDYAFGAGLRLRASVYAFAGDRLAGPALFASPLVAGSAAPDLEEYAFGGALGVALAPGATYAFVLSSLEGTPDYALNFFGATAADGYAGGALFASTASGAAALFGAGAFAPIAGSPDAAFRATFAAGPAVVPEPGTAALVAAGGLALAGAARRRAARRRPA
jgi:hypothetical protein